MKSIEYLNAPILLENSCRCCVLGTNNLDKLKFGKNSAIAVIHSTKVNISLSLNQSPFNVGLPIKLSEFTPEQVQELARRHGLEWSDSYPVGQLMNMVGGHPYLVHLALYYLAISLQQNPRRERVNNRGKDWVQVELKSTVKSGSYSNRNL